MTSPGRWSRVLPRRRRWLRTLRRRILVLIISLNGPKKLAQKALFLFVIFGIGGLRRLRRLPGLRNRLTSDRGLGLLSGIRHRRGCRRLRTHSEELLEEVTLVAGGHLAGLARLCAGNKGGRIIVGANRCGQVIRYFVESYFDHARWRCKVLYPIFVLRKGNGPLHELCPDRGRGLGALKAQLASRAHIAVVVKANPHDGEQVGGVSREPSVVRSARLARSRGSETVAAAHSCCRAVVDDPFHHLRDHIRNARIKNLAGIGCEVLDYVALGIANGGDENRRDARSAVGENRVRTGHLHGRGVVGANGHGGSGTHRLDSGGSSEGYDFVISHRFCDLDGCVVQRMRQREAGTDGSEILVLEILWRVDLVFILEDGRSVVDNAGRRECRLRPSQPCINRGGKDEWLEDRSRRTACHSMIQLAEAIIASA